LTDESYKRGQIFGFTVAEAILLVVFTLLLLLAGRLVAEQEEKQSIEREKELVEEQKNKVQEALAQIAGEEESDKIFVILDRWKKGVEAEIKRLPEETVTYREFKDLLDIVSKKIGLDASPDESVRKLTELVSVAEKGRQLGLTEATTPEQLSVFREALKNEELLNKAALSQKLGACEIKNDNLNRQLQRASLEGEVCQKEVQRLTGGYGLPPCWINPRTKEGVVTFSIEIQDNDMMVKPVVPIQDYRGKPAYLEIAASESFWDRRLSPAEFRTGFGALRVASREAKPNACEIWVRVQDCVSNDKSAYKARLGDVSTVFRNRGGATCQNQRS